jgi:hypothetical protein
LSTLLAEAFELHVIDRLVPDAVKDDGFHVVVRLVVADVAVGKPALKKPFKRDRTMPNFFLVFRGLAYQALLCNCTVDTE